MVDFLRSHRFAFPRTSVDLPDDDFRLMTMISWWSRFYFRYMWRYFPFSNQITGSIKMCIPNVVSFIPMLGNSNHRQSEWSGVDCTLLLCRLVPHIILGTSPKSKSVLSLKTEDFTLSPYHVYDDPFVFVSFTGKKNLSRTLKHPASGNTQRTHPTHGAHAGCARAGFGCAGGAARKEGSRVLCGQCPTFPLENQCGILSLRTDFFFWVWGAQGVCFDYNSDAMAWYEISKYYTHDFFRTWWCLQIDIIVVIRIHKPGRPEQGSFSDLGDPWGLCSGNSLPPKITLPLQRWWFEYVWRMDFNIKLYKQWMQLIL